MLCVQKIISPEVGPAQRVDDKFGSTFCPFRIKKFITNKPF